MREYLKNALTKLGMSLPAQWNLIFERRSAKSFSKATIGEEDQLAVLSFLDDCQMPFVSYDLHIDWVTEETIDNLFYNRKRNVISCPQYLIFRCVPNDKTLYNLGAVLQQLSLWLHAKGYSARLQSNFYIGIDDDEAYNDYADVRDGVMASFDNVQPILLPLVMAIGTPEDDIGTMKRRTKLRKKQVSGVKDSTEPAMYRIISAALASPTERGENPWHFAIRDGSIDVFMKKRHRFYKKQRILMRKVGAGCLMANSIYAASLLKKEVVVLVEEQLAPKHDYNYVCTLQVRQGIDNYS